jgi:SagB-type dehydrogenase family enzyme
MKKPDISKETGRYFLKDHIRLAVDWRSTPQACGTPPPAIQKPAPEGAKLIPLPAPEQWDIAPCNLIDALARRKSHRSFRQKSLSLNELAFLLWATQGVRTRLHDAAVLRTVPSAGCRHPFETYVAALNIKDLPPAIYRYLPLDHALIQQHTPKKLAASLAAAAHGQNFAGQAAATFIWTALPARTEWRYAEASYKVIALDAGHVCQNLYLACEAINAGTCAIAAYNQDLADALLGIDGEEEFTVYLAPVGKV